MRKLLLLSLIFNLLLGIFVIRQRVAIAVADGRCEVAEKMRQLSERGEAACVERVNNLVGILEGRYFGR